MMCFLLPSLALAAATAGAGPVQLDLANWMGQLGPILGRFARLYRLYQLILERTGMRSRGGLRLPHGC